MKKRLGLFGLIILLIVAGLIILPHLPSGTGSERYGRKWSNRFKPIGSIEAARERYPKINYKKYPDGRWIFYISSNSHFNPWGGTIVTKDDRGKIYVFYGHVCGAADMVEKSLDDEYKRLLKIYGTSREDGQAKQAAFH